MNIKQLVGFSVFEVMSFSIFILILALAYQKASETKEKKKSRRGRVDYGVLESPVSTEHYMISDSASSVVNLDQIDPELHRMRAQWSLVSRNNSSLVQSDH